MTKSVFKSQDARDKISKWYDKFRARLPYPTESRSVMTKFGDTHVLVGGPVDAPPLVLLHGALASSAHALHELYPLLERFRVHAIDVIGQSVKSADARPSVKDNSYGEWLVEVMDGLQLPKAHFVGISWGGFCTIRFATVAPERIDRLALLVPAGLVNGSAWAGLTKLGIPMAMYRKFPTDARLEKFAANLLTTTNDDWKPYLGDAFLSYNMDMRIPPLAKPAELAKLTAPTMVFAADNDLSFPGQKLLDRAKEVFPTLVATELLENCRHCPPTTDEFRRFLGGKLVSFLSPS